MSLPVWREEPISRLHDRASFDCGDMDLNAYLLRNARQNHERGGAKTFVAVDVADGVTLHGYYSIAPTALDFDQTPEVQRRGLGRYDIPGFRLVRLAIDSRFQRRGLGRLLLLAAARRCIRAAGDVGGVVLVIDAKDAPTALWYERLGAIPTLDRPLTLSISLESLRQILIEADRL